MKKHTTESLIFKTKLSSLFDPHIIQHICNVGYKKTGNKFSINFCGSKGYLSHLEISCEGCQKEDNRFFGIFNNDGSVRKKLINIFHSETNGVRLSIGSDKPRVVELASVFKPKKVISGTDGDDDLPF